MSPITDQRSATRAAATGRYNAVSIDGMFENVPSCANDWLLKTTLRDSWKFDGYVTWRPGVWVAYNVMCS